jgi:hypothetical protein
LGDGAKLSPEITGYEQIKINEKSLYPSKNILPVLQFLKKLTLTPKLLVREHVASIFSVVGTNKFFWI